MSTKVQKLTETGYKCSFICFGKRNLPDKNQALVKD